MPPEKSTEINWLALEYVIKYTRDDKDLCRVTSRACAVLQGKDYVPFQKSNKFKQLVKC